MTTIGKTRPILINTFLTHGHWFFRHWFFGLLVGQTREIWVRIWSIACISSKYCIRNMLNYKILNPKSLSDHTIILISSPKRISNLLFEPKYNTVMVPSTVRYTDKFFVGCQIGVRHAMWDNTCDSDSIQLIKVSLGHVSILACGT